MKKSMVNHILDVIGEEKGLKIGENNYCIDESEKIDYSDVQKIMINFAKDLQEEQIKRCALFAASKYHSNNGASYPLIKEIYNHVLETIRVI